MPVDTVRYPHDDNADYIHRIDEAVAAEAARYIGENGPDLSWVYLQYTDDMGHRFGDSEKFYEAIRMADNQVGKVWQAIRKRELESAEEWLIVITTDHGRDAHHGQHHGGQSDRERLTWIVTNARNLNERFKQTPGVVDIMPSIANHLKIPLPDEVKKEIDGVPFIGEADFSDLTAQRKNGKISLQWKSLSEGGEKAEIFIALTNHFKVGAQDQYRKVGDVFIREETFSFDVDGEGTFYKVIMKGPHHYINTWIVN